VTLATKSVYLLVTFAALASLAACGSGHRAATTMRSPSAKTEIFRWANPSAPPLYVQVQGPAGSVGGLAHLIRNGFPKAGGPMTRVPRALGPQACSLDAGSVTIRLYGNKSFARSICTGIRKALARG
jgi:hypothetical protein